MPTYLFRCPKHGDFEEWHSIHGDSRYTQCARCGCDAPKVLVPPTISVTATPNRTPAAHDAIQRDRHMAKDMDAYKRIRANGLQPPRIDGCAELEARGNTRTEIEMGRRLPSNAAWVGSEIASEMMGKEVGEMVRGTGS